MIAIKNAVWFDNENKLEHRVLEVSSEGVVTWSEPIMKKDIHGNEQGGFSFFGPARDFYKRFQFRRAA